MALEKALARRDRLTALVADCLDDRQAAAALSREFGFTDLQAIAVLDMQVRCFTQLDRDRIAAEVAALTAAARSGDRPPAAGERRWHTVELARPELYIEPATRTAPSAWEDSGPGSLVSVARDADGVETAVIWVGWTYGRIRLGIEIGTGTPTTDRVDEWETIEAGTIDLPAPAVLTRTPLTPNPRSERDTLLSLPSGLHLMAVSARGRDRHRSDVAILIQLWPATARADVRTIKRGDSFDLAAYNSSRAVVVRHSAPAPAVPTPTTGVRTAVSTTSARSVTDQWRRLRRVVERRCHDRSVWPSLVVSGAGSAAIDRAEQRTGVVWHTELREWFTLHNGGGGRELLPGTTLLGLEQMVALHATQRAIWDDLAADASALHDSPPEADITLAGTEAGRFVPAFIPITERDGTMLVCDTRPGPAHGCVTEFGKDTADAYPPRWASLGALLSDLADSLDQGTPFGETFAPVFDVDGLRWALVEPPR